MASLVTTSETEVIVLSVDGNVLIVPLAEFLNGSLNNLDSSGFTHGLGAEVGVTTSTVPVTLERFGVEGNLDAPLLSNADEEVAGHPEMVTHGDTLTRADLEFPLRRHDFGINARNVDASVETSAVVCFDKITSEDLTGTWK